MRRKVKIAIMIGVLMFVVGLGIGYQMGELKGIDWCVDKGIKLFIDEEDIKIGKNLIKFGIYYNMNKIDRLDYAFILNNSGN